MNSDAYVVLKRIKPEEQYSPAEAAKTLRTNRSIVSAWIKRGLTHEVNGKGETIKGQDLIDWLQSQPRVMSRMKQVSDRVHLKTIKLSDEEVALLERVRGDRTMTDTIVSGLRCLEASHNEMSDEYLLYELRKRLKAVGK